MNIPLTPPKPAGYAIYNPVTELWSRGGTGPKWNKKSPKVWTNIGHLKNHLALHVTGSYGRRRSVFIVPKEYASCMLIDLATGREHDTLTVRGLMYEYAHRQIASRASYQGYTVVEE